MPEGMARELTAHAGAASPGLDVTPVALAHSRLRPPLPAASHSQPAPTLTLRVPLRVESFGEEK